MANENDVRIHTPAPTAARGGGADRVHISVPRPLPRSISWVPTDIPAEVGNEPIYDVFITQEALSQLLDHVREPTSDGRPFGLLAGDLCEDLDDGRRYVLIGGVCPSPVPLLDDPQDLIPADAWDTGCAEIWSDGTSATMRES